MPINKVQFQKGLSLTAFLERYGKEQQCEDALVAARWPQGWRCARCNSQRHTCIEHGRRLWVCLDCAYQSSSIVGTVFEHTKLPLTVWFLAIYSNFNSLDQ